MKKLGKKFVTYKETVQSYSPCGNGCLCGGCNTSGCACAFLFIDAFGSTNSVLTAPAHHNDSLDHN